MGKDIQEKNKRWRESVADVANLHVVTITLPPTPIMRAFFSGMAAKILHIVKNV